MSRVRIDLAYDGRPFSGFARQPDRPTVQGTLEGALTRLLGQDVVTTGAGRTDAGVHALAQVVHLDVEPSVARAARALDHLDALRLRLDRMVGDAIAIWAVTAAPGDFDARFSATARAYRYCIWDGAPISPLRRFDRWVVDDRLALRAMQRASRLLLGEHDFASFCRRAPDRHTLRRLDEVAVSRAGAGEIHVRLRGPAFCHQQVRAIVGCLVEVGRGKREPAWVGEVLAARDRSVAARVAPAHGLTLERVSYGRRFPAAPPHGRA